MVGSRALYAYGSGGSSCAIFASSKACAISFSSKALKMTGCAWKIHDSRAWLSVAAHIFVTLYLKGCAMARLLQRKLHVQRSRHRIFAIGRDFLEPQLAIHRHCIFHHGSDGIETHALIADRAGVSYQALHDGSSDSLAAKLRTEVEALHLA